MSERTNSDLFRDYIEVWDSGNLDDLKAVIHDDYVGHPSSGDRNEEGLRQRIAAFRQEYPGARFKIEDQLVEADKIASRLVATATRAADGQHVVLYV